VNSILPSSTSLPSPAKSRLSRSHRGLLIVGLLALLIASRAVPSQPAQPADLGMSGPAIEASQPLFWSGRPHQLDLVPRQHVPRAFAGPAEWSTDDQAWHVGYIVLTTSAANIGTESP
jgi:hypothetical protein